MYKFTIEGNILNLENKTYVPSNDPTYLAWLALGNTTEPIVSITDLRNNIKHSLALKSDELTSSLGDKHTKLRKLTKSILLVNKKVKNTITPEEQTKLDALEAFATFVDILDDFIDNELEWVNDPNRTYSELFSYDVNSPATGSWPTL